MIDECRKAAEQYANRVRGDAFDRLRGTPPREWKEARDAYLAGQECERDAVVRWLCSSPLYTDLAAAILRGEHRGGE